MIVASPCWAGAFDQFLMPKPMERALAALSADALRGVRCSGISVHSGIGGDNTIRRLGEILAQKGNTDYRPGPAARAGVPFSLWVGPSVKPEDEARFRAYGTAFVA